MLYSHFFSQDKNEYLSLKNIAFQNLFEILSVDVFNEPPSELKT